MKRQNTEGTEYECTQDTYDPNKMTIREKRIRKKRIRIIVGDKGKKEM